MHYLRYIKHADFNVWPAMFECFPLINIIFFHAMFPMATWNWSQIRMKKFNYSFEICVKVRNDIDIYYIYSSFPAIYLILYKMIENLHKIYSLMFILWTKSCLFNWMRHPVFLPKLMDFVSDRRIVWYTIQYYLLKFVSMVLRHSMYVWIKNIFLSFNIYISIHTRTWGQNSLYPEKNLWKSWKTSNCVN